MMPRVFTNEQLQWMKDKRRAGDLPPQIAKDFPIRFPGEKKPATTTVYKRTEDVPVLVEEEDLEDEESLEETGTPKRPVSEEKKKKEDLILNEFIAKKSLKEILENPEFHHDTVFKMQKIHNEKVINDEITRCKNLLVGAGVYNAKSKNPIPDAILALVEIAGKAESDLEFTRSTIESDKNKIFGEYQEREDDLNRKLLEQKETLTEKIHIIERSVRENQKTFSCKEIQWANYTQKLEEDHEKQIGLWRKEVQDIAYHSLQYTAAMDFTKSPDAEKEIYLRGIFNTIVLLYGPFDENKKLRKKIENKLWNATRDRDWRKFTDALSELAKKVGPYAEKLAKEESIIVSLAKSDAQKELYNKLEFFGFKGSLQDLTEALDNYRTLPSELERMERLYKELKPKMEELESNEKLLELWIPKLLELKDMVLENVNNATASILALLEKNKKWMPPQTYSTFKKDISEPITKMRTDTDKVLSSKEGFDQTLSEYLESRRERMKKHREP